MHHLGALRRLQPQPLPQSWGFSLDWSCLGHGLLAGERVNTVPLPLPCLLEPTNPSLVLLSLAIGLHRWAPSPPGPESSLGKRPQAAGATLARNTLLLQASSLTFLPSPPSPPASPAVQTQEVGEEEQVGVQEGGGPWQPVLGVLREGNRNTPLLVGGIWGVAAS